MLVSILRPPVLATPKDHTPVAANISIPREATPIVVLLNFIHASKVKSPDILAV